ncbi:MAG: BrnT family toxin, partial [Chloroflexota bacterium]
LCSSVGASLKRPTPPSGAVHQAGGASLAPCYACDLLDLYSLWMQFEWDPEKDEQNRAKHGVSFEEASSVFGDPLALTIGDPDHSHDEDRFLTTGFSLRQRVIIVAHTEQADRIRIISAREVTAAERQVYEEGN